MTAAARVPQLFCSEGGGGGDCGSGNSDFGDSWLRACASSGVL